MHFCKILESTGEHGDQLEFSVTVNGSVNWHNDFGDELAIMKGKLRMYRSYDSAILHNGFKIKIDQKPIKVEWISQFWDIHTVRALHNDENK